MSVSQIQAGKAYVAIYGDLSPLRQDLKKLAPELRKQGEQLAKIGESTASTFSKGTAEILKTTDGTKAATVAFNIAAIASNSFSASANDALTSTAASSRTTATATQKLVEQMNAAKPASKGFATAFGSLKSMDVTLANGAFGVNSIIKLLKAGGPATQPLLDAMTRITDQATKLQSVKIPSGTPGHIASGSATRPVQPPTQNKATGQLTIAELSIKLNEEKRKIYDFLRNQKINAVGKSGNANLYDPSVMDLLEKHFGQAKNAANPPSPAKGLFARALSSIHAAVVSSAKGTTVGLNGGAAGMVLENKAAMMSLAVAAGLASGAIQGTSKSTLFWSKIALSGINNLVTGLSGAKSTFIPWFTQLTAAQKIATDAQTLSRFAGNKQQRQAAKQMGLEADAAAVGAAFARGWLPGFAKYVGVGLPRVVMASLKGIGPLGAAGATAGAMFAGPFGAAVGGAIGIATPRLTRGLIGLFSGARSSASAITNLGGAALSAVPKLNTVHRAIDNVRRAAAGQGLSVAHGLGIGAFAVAAAGAIGGISHLAGHHNGESSSRIESIGLSAAKNKRSVMLTSELDFAAKATGTSLKTLDGAFDHLSEQITKANDGEESAIKNFTKLGLSAESLKKMSLEQKMARVGAAMAAVQDPIDRDRLAINLLGDSGNELTAMLGNLNDLRHKAHTAGAIVHKDDVEAAKKMSLAMANLKAVLTSAWNQIGTASIRSTTMWVSGAVKFLERNQAVVTSLLKIVAGVGAAAGGMVLWAQFGGPVISIIKSIGMAVAALMSPIGLIAIGIGAGVAAWMYFTDSGRAAAANLSGAMTQFMEVFKGAWEGIVAAVGKGDLALAGNIAWTALKLGFLEAIQSMGVSFSEVMKNIYEAVNFVSDAISTVWAAIVAPLKQTQLAIASYLIMSFDNIGAAWEVMCLDLEEAFSGVHNKIAKKIGDLASALKLLAPALNLVLNGVDNSPEFKKSMDEETKGRATARAAKRTELMNKFEPATKAQVEQNNKDSADAPGKAKADRDKAINDHAELLRQRVAALTPDDKRIGEMKEKLAGMIADAKTADSDPAKKPPKFTADAPQLAAKEASVAGTFNVAAAAGLGGGGGPAEQTAKSTAEMVKEIKAVRDALRERRSAKDDATRARRVQAGASFVGPKLKFGAK